MVKITNNEIAYSYVSIAHSEFSCGSSLTAHFKRQGLAVTD